MTVTQGDVPRRHVRRALLAGATLLVLLGCLAPAGMAWSSEPSAQSALTTSAKWGPWMQLYGRMHVILVHFPIGLLIAAGIIEVFRAGRMGQRPGTATLVCLGIGWIAAALAAYSGWTYAEMERHGHSPDGLLFWHRWGGVAVASCGCLSWLLGLLGRSGRRQWARSGFFMLLFVTTVLTGVVGHLGGSLVYGEDYLTEPFTNAERARHGWVNPNEGEDPQPVPSEQDAAPQASDQSHPVEDHAGENQAEPKLLDNEDSGATEGAGEGAGEASANSQAEAQPLTEELAYQAVEPIFDLSCTHCHGARKAKAGLRLHEVARLFEGDPVDWVVVPGHPEKSELMRRVSLPLDHEDGMPSDDDPLPADEIALIRTWIETMDPIGHGLPSDGGNAGSAILGDWSQVSLGPTEEPENRGANSDQKSTEAGADDATVEAAQPETETDRVDEAQPQPSSETVPRTVEEALDVLRDRGAVANRVATDAEQVEVLFGLLREDVTDTDLSLLAGLEGVLVSLDLAQTSVSDVGLKGLSAFTQLERLHLEGTKITDAGLSALEGWHSLEYLNLYGTKITDGGLAHLKGLTNLSKLYLWQTAVSDEGIASLQEAIPGLEIVRDLVLPAPPPDLVVVEGETTFEQDAGPILRAKCLDCHSAEDPAAGLVFESFEAMFKGPWAEWAVRPGEVDSSRLVRALRKEPGTKGAMPKKGERVTEEELDVLIAWVEGLREEEAPPGEE